VRTFLLSAVALSLLAGSATAKSPKVPCAVNGSCDLNAPYPRAKKGDKFCMTDIHERDPFYALCRACEKNVKYCTGDLRDRGRGSPYTKGGRCYGKYVNCV
jgi:hypothetical protein